MDAGQWLAKISDGKYTRIWTPLDEDALYVDDNSGQTWGVDMLSRGTRESVFICLRLALVNSYIKRGVRLPLILDDVLVNCDSNRAKHGVTMLRDFAAQGTQVFFFTCHSHLASSFESAGADVRELTLRENVVAPDIQRFSITSSKEHDEIVTRLESSRTTVNDKRNVAINSEVDCGDGESSDTQDTPVPYVDQHIENVPMSLLGEEHVAVSTTDTDIGITQTEEMTITTKKDVDLLSTEQEIAVVDRLVETVAGEMDQIDARPDTKSHGDGPEFSNMDIGDLVERAMEESHNEAVEEVFDEIEIIDEDDFEMDSLAGDVQDAPNTQWQEEAGDDDEIDGEDELAA